MITQDGTSVGYIYTSASIPKREIPLQTNNLSNISRDDLPLQISMTSVTVPKTTDLSTDPSDYVISRNPLDDEFIRQYNDITMKKGDATLMMFEYTSVYEGTIYREFPEKTAEAILKWVKDKDGLYTRQVVFEDDEFRVCSDGEWVKYPYGTSIEWLLSEVIE